MQEDVTNWMHPLGFAYYPDGAHGFKQYAEVFIHCCLNSLSFELYSFRRILSIFCNKYSSKSRATLMNKKMPFWFQVPELEEPHPETCNEQQFLCNPNNKSSKVKSLGKRKVRWNLGTPSSAVWHWWSFWDVGQLEWWNIRRIGCLWARISGKSSFLPIPSINPLPEGSSRPMEGTQVRSAVNHSKGVKNSNILLLLPHTQVNQSFFALI